MSTPSKHALAVSAFMILGWIVEALPHAVIGVLGCYLFSILGVAPFHTAFSGFAESTTWFLLGALLIAKAVMRSGLGRRLACLVIRATGVSYSRILLGLILTSFLLTFLVPSGIACLVIMASVALGLIKILDLPDGSNFSRGIFIALTYTAGVFDKMVLAGASSILGRGLIEKATNAPVYWSAWLLAFLPCAVITIGATWRIIIWMYPAESVSSARANVFLDEQLRQLGPWSPAEMKTLALVLTALLLWMTDFLHRISPAIIGIGAGLVAALPRVGILDQEDLKGLNYLPVCFVATALSMGEVLMRTGALSTITDVMFGWMAPHLNGALALPFVTYWTAFAYHILLGNEISMLSASLPSLLRFVGAHGQPALPFGLVWTFASGGKIFVYQSGVTVMGYAYGYFEARDLFRVGLALTILESLLLLVVVPFYWPLIGIR
jgi:anion transporter